MPDLKTLLAANDCLLPLTCEGTGDAGVILDASGTLDIVVDPARDLEDETSTTIALLISGAVNDHDRLVKRIADLRKVLEGVQPYMEEAEKAGLVGDEGCHWPVEAVRAALAEVD